MKDDRRRWRGKWRARAAVVSCRTGRPGTATDAVEPGRAVKGRDDHLAATGPDGARTRLARGGRNDTCAGRSRLLPRVDLVREREPVGTAWRRECRPGRD